VAKARDLEDVDRGLGRKNEVHPVDHWLALDVDEAHRCPLAKRVCWSQGGDDVLAASVGLLDLGKQRHHVRDADQAASGLASSRCIADAKEQEEVGPLLERFSHLV
jgi:hypothetical protein